jgi:DNA polymerase zeta
MLIPPLTRIFNLLGADVEGWYKAMSKPKVIADAPFGRKDKEKAVGRVRMTSFFRSVLCWLCGEETSRGERVLPGSYPLP